VDTNKVHVSRGSIFFPSFRHSASYPEGATITQILLLDKIPETLWNCLEVKLNNEYVPKDYWPRVKPRVGTLVNIGICPATGSDNVVPTNTNLIDKGTIRLLAFLTTTIAANAIPSLIGLAGPWGVVVQTVFSIIGIFLSSTFIAAPSDPEEIERYSLESVQNRMRPYQAVQKHYGKMRVYPDLASVPFTEIVGDDQYINLLFCIGYSPLVVTEIKIGEKDISEFLSEGVTIGLSSGWGAPSDVVQDFSLGSDPEQIMVNEELEYAPSWYKDGSVQEKCGSDTVVYFWGVDDEGNAIYSFDPPPTLHPKHLQIRADHRETRISVHDGRLRDEVHEYLTPMDTVRIGLDLMFPDGLYNTDTDGNVNSERVDVAIRYRPKGATGYNNWTYVYPYWNNPNLVAEVQEITIIVALQALQSGLQDIQDFTAQMQAVPAVERELTVKLHTWADERINNIIDKTVVLIRDPSSLLTLAQKDIFSQLRTSVINFKAETDNTTDVSSTDDLVSVGPEDVNTVLSAAQMLLSFFEDSIAVSEYIAQGIGPEAATLRPFHRYLIHKRNLGRLFGPPEAGSFAITQIDARAGLFRRGLEFSVLKGQYEVQVRRSSIKVTADNIHHIVLIGSFRSFSAHSPVSDFVAENMVLMHMRVRATEELNSTVDIVNCIVETPLHYWDGAAWSEDAVLTNPDTGDNVSQSPAWAFADIIRGSASEDPVSDSSVDTTRLLEFADYCTENGYYFNGTFDRAKTVEESLQDVCRVAKGSISLRDGRFSLVYEHEQSTPVALITPRNIAPSFSASKTMIAPPDALRMKFKNPDNGYQMDEMYVYCDWFGSGGASPVEVDRYFNGGEHIIVVPYMAREVHRVYDRVTGLNVPPASWTWRQLTTLNETWITYQSEYYWPEGELRYKVTLDYNGVEPTNVESIDMIGLVDTHDRNSSNHTGQVYRLGRTILAAAEWRPEIFTVTMDLERLICERGDLVQFAHDVVKWGHGSARITGNIVTSGGKLVSCDIDETMTQVSGAWYSVRILTLQGHQVVQALVQSPGSSTNITFAWGGVDLDGDTIVGGELVAFGLNNKETFPCLVMSIRPNSKDGAVLTLVRDHPAVHNAEFTSIPDHIADTTDPPQIFPLAPSTPIVRSITTNEGALVRLPNGQLDTRVLLELDFPDNDQLSNGANNVFTVEVQLRATMVVHSTEGSIVAKDLTLTQDPQAGKSSWRAIQTFAENLTSISIDRVSQGQSYDFRLRAHTRLGVASDWAFLEDIYVTGKLTPPPDPRDLVLIDGVLNWSYHNEPVDFKGFQVRTFEGGGGTWDSATPMHGTLIQETMFALPHGYGGQRTFFVKAFDIGIIASVNAAWLSINLGGTIVDNLMVSEDHQELGWPGTIENMTEVSGGSGTQLEEDAGSSENFYKTGNWHRFYLEDTSSFYETDYLGCVYSFSHTPDALDIPYTISVDVEASAEDWIIEHRKADPLVFPSDLSMPVFPTNKQAGVFPYTEMGWRPYFAPVPALSQVEQQFRIVSYPNDTKTTITKVVVQGDVLDIIEKVDGFVVAATGTVRLPLLRKYRKIVHVSMTLYQAASPHTDVFVAHIVDRNVPGPADRLGPSIIVLDKTGARASGIVDAIVQGY